MSPPTTSNWNGSGLCSSFKVELLQGVHALDTDTCMIALYGDDATLSVDTTTAYVTDGEISGPGYTPGGTPLQNPIVLGPMARTAYVTWDDPIWPNSTLMARGALIYNSSKQQRAVCILDFTTDQFSNSGMFRVKLPSPGPTTALIRML